MAGAEEDRSGSSAEMVRGDAPPRPGVDGLWRRGMAPLLCAPITLEIHRFHHDLIAGRDDARVGLEAPLRDDEFRELIREVDVGRLQGSGGEGPASAGAGISRVSHARVRGLQIDCFLVGGRAAFGNVASAGNGARGLHPAIAECAVDGPLVPMEKV